MMMITIHVSVHSPLLFPGSADILSAISAGETPALPGGSERLLKICVHTSARREREFTVAFLTAVIYIYLIPQGLNICTLKTFQLANIICPLERAGVGDFATAHAAPDL